MTAKSALLYVPGFPLTLDAVLPKAPLAALAELLLMANRAPQVFDFGAVEFLERLIAPQTAQALSEQLALGENDHTLDPLDSLACRWQLRELDRVITSRLNVLCAEAAGSLAQNKGLDLAVFYLKKGPGLHASRQLASELRRRRPDVRIIGWGPDLGALAPALLRELPCFDAICVGASAADAALFSQEANCPERWALVPNLVFRKGRRVVQTERVTTAPAPNTPVGYAPELYPAMDGNGLLKLLTVQTGSGCIGGCLHCDHPQDDVRMRDAKSVCDDIAACERVLGAQVFHLQGTSLRPRYVDSVAHTLLHRGLSVRYSHTGRIEHATPAAYPLLWTSGCRAADFRVETGSQLLLDRMYGRRFGVSQAEDVVRSCREAGIATTVRFTYPCPGDDHHTLDETMRFILRTRPNAVDVALPEMAPGSTWFCDPKAFGFEALSDRQIARYWVGVGASPAQALCFPSLPGRVGTRATWAAAGENAALKRAVRQQGIPVGVDGRLMLIAAACGFERRTVEFCRLAKSMFLSGDSDELACLTARFNEASRTPVSAGQAWGSLDAAVGN